MADLFDRIFVPSIDDAYEEISIHYFRGAIGDYAAGYTTRNQIIAHWSLDASAETDLNVICDALDAMTPLQKAGFLIELHDVINLAEGGIKYTDKASFKTRMGL